jgi:hypothetical protein
MIPVYWVLLQFLSWDEEIYLLIAALLTSIFLGDLIDLIYSILQTPKRFIAWDKVIIVNKERNTLKYFPAHQLTKVDFESFNEQYFAIKLTFTNGSIEWPQSKSRRQEAEEFCQSLIASANEIKKKLNLKKLTEFINSGELNEVERMSYQFLAEPTRIQNLDRKTSLNYVQRNFITIPSVIGVFLLQFFLLPYGIDFFAFDDSRDKNTATAYRKYLSEPRNKLYRGEAENNIQNLYNGYIHKLRDTKESFEKFAIIKTLEYLRDNRIFSVNINFSFSSNVRDIYRQGVNVISAENSFTKEKNDNREARLVQEINNSIGKILPTDIVTFIRNNDMNSPTIEINYEYLNSKDNSLYYPVAQENLPENQRTYYYGISVNWRFKWYLPSDKNSIVAFDLVSSPRIQFLTKSLASDDTVYSDMIYTAFEEMADEFKKLYLPIKKI